MEELIKAVVLLEVELNKLIKKHDNLYESGYDKKGYLSAEDGYGHREEAEWAVEAAREKLGAKDAGEQDVKSAVEAAHENVWDYEAFVEKYEKNHW